MAVTVWAPIQSRSGSAVSPALRVPDGTLRIYARVDGLDAGESLTYSTQWSADDANNANQVSEASWQPLGGGAFVGGTAVPSDPKLAEYSFLVGCPSEARWVRAAYTVTSGTATFGVSGEFRTTAAGA